MQPHNSLDPYDLRKHRAAKSAYGPLVARPMLGGAARVIVTSERERERLVLYGARCHVDVVGLPVAGPAGRPDGDGFRLRHGIPKGAPVVLFLSRLDPKKGLERLFAAVSQLRSDHPGLVLLVVGAADEPEYGRSLTQRAEDAGLSGSVVWAGHVGGATRWDAFAAGDVFALPSDNENFGIVVLESLLAGTPVVISSEVYIADDLEAAGLAAVCGTDVRTLAEALDAALSSQPADSAEASRAAIEAAFSPEAITKQTLAVYEDVLDRERRPA